MLPEVTPDTKFNAVEDPKAIPSIMGLIDGAGDAPAPEKVRDTEPAYPVARLLKAS